jgi:hypothetical protein
VDIPLAARTQTVLEGVRLPATRAELERHARDAAADDEVLAAIARLPDRRYGRIDDVGELIAPTHPGDERGLATPRPHSGAPPGGDDYLVPSPSPGEIRPGSTGGGPAS